MPEPKENNTGICTHDKCAEFCEFGTTTLYKCGSCNLIFTAKAHDYIDPKNLYKNFYKLKNASAGRFNFGIERIIRSFRFFRAFKIFTISPRSKTILDIGSGRGFMLYYLKKYYHYTRTVGTQISKIAYEFSRYKLGLEIYDKDLLDMPINNNTFDIITIFHVLEHIPNPDKYMQRISELLNKDGKLIIEVPNFNSWSRMITGKYWLGLDLQNHIYFFTIDTLSALLEKHKFKIKYFHTFSLEYSTFISTQSLVSLITKTDQLFFRGIQAMKNKRSFVAHLFLFIVLAIPCFLVNIVLYFSKRGEVLLIIAEKSHVKMTAKWR